jgi:DNA-binding CsgD family transcriptional regulator
MLLQSEAAALVAGAMEALSLAVFVCDSGGRVRAMSANAEALLAGGEHLRLKDRRLEAIGDADTRALAAMVQGAAFAQQLAPCRPPTVLVLRSKSGRDPLLLEVSSVPGAIHNFGFGVAALVIARGSRRVERRSAQLASALYGLTQAEAAVAADLVDGLSPAAIAQRAGVSLHTIRTHIKRILEKADVHSQVEFVSSISARL